MSDVSPYGVTQNANAERVTADALVGERAGAATAEAMVGSPSMDSTAPYRPPMVGGRKASRVGRCIGKNDTCMASPVRGTDRCIFHGPGGRWTHVDQEEVEDQPAEPA